MVEEITQDITTSRLYMSPRLNTVGQAQYPTLLTEAAQTYDDAWLAQQICMKGLLKTEETRRTPSGGTTTARVPVTAPDTLAEGEFNGLGAADLFNHTGR